MSWVDARRGGSEPPSHYRTAEVCLNGHATTSNCEGSPELRSNFCAKCGAATISACPECNTNIRGYYFVYGVITTRTYQPPSYCHNCGKPLPWTRRSIEAARELTDEFDVLTTEEKSTLKATFEDLTLDSPKTPVATVRYKKFLAKVGPVLGDTLNKIVVPVATEAVKKMLGL